MNSETRSGSVCHCVVPTSDDPIAYSLAIPATSDDSAPTSLVPPPTVQDLAQERVVAAPVQLRRAMRLRAPGQQLSMGEHARPSDHLSIAYRNVAAGPRTSQFGPPDRLLAREGHDLWLYRHATYSIHTPGIPVHRLRAEQSAMQLRHRLSLQYPRRASHADQLTFASGLHYACAQPPFSERTRPLGRLRLLVPRARAGLLPALPSILGARHRLSSVGSNGRYL